MITYSNPLIAPRLTPEQTRAQLLSAQQNIPDWLRETYERQAAVWDGTYQPSTASPGTLSVGGSSTGGPAPAPAPTQYAVNAPLVAGPSGDLSVGGSTTTPSWLSNWEWYQDQIDPNGSAAGAQLYEDLAYVPGQPSVQGETDSYITQQLGWYNSQGIPTWDQSTGLGVDIGVPYQIRDGDLTISFGTSGSPSGTDYTAPITDIYRPDSNDFMKGLTQAFLAGTIGYGAYANLAGLGAASGTASSGGGLGNVGGWAAADQAGAGATNWALSQPGAFGVSGAIAPGTSSVGGISTGGWAAADQAGAGGGSIWGAGNIGGTGVQGAPVGVSGTLPAGTGQGWIDADTIGGDGLSPLLSNIDAPDIGSAPGGGSTPPVGTGGGGTGGAGGGTFDWGSFITDGLLPGIASIWNANNQADAADEAAQLQYQATQDALALQEQMFNQQMELQQPFTDMGTAAIPGLMNTINAPQFNWAQRFLNAMNRPDYNVAQELINDPYGANYLANNPLFNAAVEHSADRFGSAAAAGGKSNSGGLVDQLFQNYLATGDQYWNNYLSNRQNTVNNRLNNLVQGAGVTQQQIQNQALPVQLGQAAAAGQAANVGNFGANAGNLLLQGGNALASGEVGSANAWSGGLNDIFELLGFIQGRNA